MYIKMSRTRTVKFPARANHGDAGIDFFVPEDFPVTTLKHGESVLIPSGIKAEVPFGTALIAHNKSGVASKKKLDVMADTVDHGYAGEIHINLINNGDAEQTISPGDKIIQFIHIPVFGSLPVEVPVEELYDDIHTIGARGAGGFGSTGAK